MKWSDGSTCSKSGSQSTFKFKLNLDDPSSSANLVSVRRVVSCQGYAVVFPKTHVNFLVSGYRVSKHRFSCLREYLGFLALYGELVIDSGEISTEQVQKSWKTFSRAFEAVCMAACDDPVETGMYSLTVSSGSLFRLGMISQVLKGEYRSLAVMKSEDLLRRSFMGLGLSRDSTFALDNDLKPTGERIIVREDDINTVQASIDQMIEALKPFRVHLNRSILFHSFRLKLLEKDRSER